MVCLGPGYSVLSMITSHIEEPLNAVHLGGDNMPSRSDQIHHMRKRAAIPYLVRANLQSNLGLVMLMLIHSECDATIQRDRGSAA